MRSRSTSSDPGRLVTDIEIELEHTFKGEAPARVTVLQPGGTVGDLTQVVTHVPSFALGERVVLFLERRPAGRYRVIRGEQGKFNLDEATGTARAGSMVLTTQALLQQLRVGSPSSTTTEVTP